jgi:hypothetical protein
MTRTIIAGLGLASGILFGSLIPMPAIISWSPAATFEERWEPAYDLPAMRDYSPVLPEQLNSKSNRGPCVDRRPRCKLA